MYELSNPDDHQWIGQILLSSLASKNGKSFVERHSLKNYGEQLEKSLNISLFPIGNGVLPQNVELGAESNNQDNSFEPEQIIQPSPNNEVRGHKLAKLKEQFADFQRTTIIEMNKLAEAIEALENEN